MLAPPITTAHHSPSPSPPGYRWQVCSCHMTQWRTFVDACQTLLRISVVLGS